MLYPLFATNYMETVQSGIQTEYQVQLSHSSAEELQALREDAHQYNKKLASGEMSLLEPRENGYYSQMVLKDGSQIMGYVHIPKIGIDLPIYHGVDSDALTAGCGHMPQSSLPVGGESTHTVISAHTGMASSRMFSDLPLLEPGDQFQLETLGEVLTYEIQSADDIQTVLPVEVGAIQIKNGCDLATLVTCTPFGINSHRFLVTGHRVETPSAEIVVPEESETISQPAQSLWQKEYQKSLSIGFCVILIITAGSFLLIGILNHRHKGHYLNN